MLFAAKCYWPEGPSGTAVKHASDRSGIPCERLVAPLQENATDTTGDF
jgi:hypothetical protein